MIKTYSMMNELETFEERFNYLKLNGNVGESTFGSERYLNQVLYSSKEWRSIRNKVINRDEGCDLGIDDRIIFDKTFIHHINPITIEDIRNRNPVIFDMENLITVSFMTHQAIHYGDEHLLIPSVLTERSPGDTCPWKKQGGLNGK